MRVQGNSAGEGTQLCRTTVAFTLAPRQDGAVDDGCHEVPDTAYLRRSALVHNFFASDLIVGFQELVSAVPGVVQPLIIALAATVPFIEGELSSIIGVIGGINPVVAATAGMVGNFLSVVAVVIGTARVRSAAVAHVGGRDDVPRDPPTAPSKGRQRFARWLDRFGVPGASLLGPLALPTQFTSATLVASGVSVPRVLGWQAAAIVLWTTIATLSATGAIAQRCLRYEARASAIADKSEIPWWGEVHNRARHSGACI
ncbi:MAG TPA: hypothetical protein VEQ66_05310 [Propionibacteriaceae bacterium]|nr:hypothetical protein [Propionibacteriaceae bacterium]